MGLSPKSVCVFGIHIGTKLSNEEQLLVSKCLEKYNDVFYKCYDCSYDQADEDLVFVVLYETASTIDYRPQKIFDRPPHENRLLDELYDELDELNIPLEGKGVYHFLYYDNDDSTSHS
jgi:hypothetical protein